MAAAIKMPLGMKVELGPGDFVLDGDPLPHPKKGAERRPQIFDSCLLWPNGRMDQDRSWHGDRPQTRRLYVRCGPSPLPQKGDRAPPQFSADFYCGQTAGCIKMPLGIEAGLSPGDFVLWGPSPLPQKGEGAEPPPQFFGPFLWQLNGWIHQDATWYRPHPRGLCVRLGPSAPPQKGSPIFGPCLLRPNGCKDQDATWYAGRPLPR